MFIILLDILSRWCFPQEILCKGVLLFPLQWLFEPDPFTYLEFVDYSFQYTAYM